MAGLEHVTRDYCEEDKIKTNTNKKLINPCPDTRLL